MNHKLSHLIELIDKLPHAQAKLLLSKVMKENPMVGFQIITRQYGFADLRYADEQGINALVEAIPKETLICALNGSDDHLVRRFASGLSPTEATTFIDTLYAARASDAAIKNAQRKVLVKAFLLQRKGRLTVRRPSLN
jgi:flagellar motor switch protein FliG